MHHPEGLNQLAAAMLAGLPSVLVAGAVTSIGRGPVAA